jgi:hypothetical protein
MNNERTLETAIAAAKMLGDEYVEVTGEFISRDQQGMRIFLSSAEYLNDLNLAGRVFEVIRKIDLEDDQYDCEDGNACHICSFRTEAWYDTPKAIEALLITYGKLTPEAPDASQQLEEK